jgi:hypothetical protein
MVAITRRANSIELQDLVFAHAIASVTEERSGLLRVTTPQDGRDKTYDLGDQCAAAHQAIVSMLSQS